MSDVNKEIDEMAEKMEKSTKTPKEVLMDTIREIGPEKLREKIPTLSKSEKEVLHDALEEMKKAVSMDDAYAAPVIEGNVKDTKLQEEVANDDADEKLMKPTTAQHNHQGDVTPEGREGQVIKSDEEPAEEAVEKGEMMSVKEDKKEDKKIAEKEAKKEVKEHEDKMHTKKCMKKSEDEEMKEKLVALKKSIEEELGEGATPELVKAEMKTRMLKEEDQSGDAPKMEEKTRAKKEKLAEEAGEDNKKNMSKSVEWADKDQMFKSDFGGRNHSFSVNKFYDDAIEKSEKPEEELKKSEDGEAKEDLNDIIAKGGDASWDEVKTDRMIKSNNDKISGKFHKSFADNEIAQALGLTEEEAKKILGE